MHSSYLTRVSSVDIMYEYDDGPVSLVCREEN